MELDPQSNEFIEDPFKPLGFDPLHFDSDKVFLVYQSVGNALGYWVQVRLLNRKKIIGLGSKPKQDASYDGINAEKYTAEESVKILEKKMEIIEQLFRLKGQSHKYEKKGWLD